MITQAVLVQRLKASVSEYRILTGASLLLVICCLGLTFAETEMGLLLVSIPLTCANLVWSLTVSAQMSRVAPEGQKGKVVAADMALFPAIRMITPLLGTMLLDELGYWSIGAATATPFVLISALLLGKLVRFDATAYHNPSKPGAASA